MMPPRIDQIEELTRGIELPLPALHQEHFRFIVEKLSSSWAELVRRRSPALLEKDESEINALLETRLLALLDEDPLWAQMVRVIVRGRETLSFDGTHLEKRPDLSLFLTRPPAAFPFTIECKIVDRANGKTATLYCDNGVSRFLSGEYAWATREALMIAYVRDDSTIASTLAPLFAPRGAGAATPYAIQEPLSAIDIDSLDVSRSSHGRGFRYPLRQPPRDHPGAIVLWHLWLRTATMLNVVGENSETKAASVSD
jgi:hypothetical protein